MHITIFILELIIHFMYFQLSTFFREVHNRRGQRIKELNCTVRLQEHVTIGIFFCDSYYLIPCD